MSNQNGSADASEVGLPGHGMGRGRGSSSAIGRGTTAAEMNGYIPHGRATKPPGLNEVVPGPQSALKLDNLPTNSPVFSVGIGRGYGVPNGW